MEDDIEFLISALSEPNSAQEMPYSGEKLQEMRDAFVALQQLLRNNQLQAAIEASRSIPRSTAGGDQSALSSEESPESELDSVALGCSSLESGASSSEAISLECKETDLECQLIRRRCNSCSTNFGYNKKAVDMSDPDGAVIAQRVHTSTVSISLPVKLVCHRSHGPDSDTTITADGILYSLAE